MKALLSGKKMVADFQKLWYIYFIWYEAGTRLGDLIRKWYVQSRHIEYRNTKKQFKVFELTKEGRKIANSL
jgi:hypothetical protein